MRSYKDIFAERKKEIESKNIAIDLVPLSEIQKVDFLFRDGCYEIKSIDGVDSFRLMIDETSSDEMKLRILFHEHGHILHHLRIGTAEVNKKINKNKFEWDMENEYAAFKNGLIESKKLADEGNMDFLKTTVKRYIEREKTETNRAYKNALTNLIAEDFGQECIKIIEDL